MNERTMNFGEGNALLGVLTMPEVVDPAAPMILLLNAGLLHRVGPNRMYVELARLAAEAGYATLRFDMSGIGDSELTGGQLLDIERSRHDVQQAMDAMQSAMGTETFVLMGLCTGAFNAFRTALIDDRVAGCVLIDGYSYPTRRSQVRHYRRRALQLDRWVGWMQRRLGKAPAGQETDDDMIVFENEVVPKDRFGTELAALLDRHAEMLLIYTGLGPLAFNYARQMHDAFPELSLEDRATVQFYPDADHTFRLPGNRQRLFDDVVNWMGNRFPVGSSSRQAAS